MLEIIALFWLGSKIKGIVEEKGLKPWKYIAIMIICWIGLEVLFAILGAVIFESEIAAYPMALLGGICGAFLSYAIAKRATPNHPVEDANLLDDTALNN